MQGQRFFLVLHYPLSLSCPLAFAFSSPSYFFYIVSAFSPVSSFIPFSQPFPPSPSPSFVLASFFSCCEQYICFGGACAIIHGFILWPIQVQLHERIPNIMSLLSNGSLPAILFSLLLPSLLQLGRTRLRDAWRNAPSDQSNNTCPSLVNSDPISVFCPQIRLKFISFSK